MASQMPSPPMKCGRRRRAGRIRAKVREKEIMAETLPLEKAVKKAEEKMLRPAKR